MIKLPWTHLLNNISRVPKDTAEREMQSKERLRQSYFSPLRLPGQTFLAVTFSMREREQEQHFPRNEYWILLQAQASSHDPLPACLLTSACEAGNKAPSLFSFVSPNNRFPLFSFFLSLLAQPGRERETRFGERERGRKTDILI